ncbi:unnamed protein product [Amoebophrya sp. A25]|nr:unnamed protein product [Amoebophrya sp. A25]|eukprot:GSA25T00005314001.1
MKRKVIEDCREDTDNFDPVVDACTPRKTGKNDAIVDYLDENQNIRTRCMQKHQNQSGSSSSFDGKSTWSNSTPSSTRKKNRSSCIRLGAEEPAGIERDSYPGTMSGVRGGPTRGQQSGFAAKGQHRSCFASAKQRFMPDETPDAQTGGGRSKDEQSKRIERIESQRCWFWGGFSSSRLLFSDPPPWRDERGFACEAPKSVENGIRYRWEVRVSPVTDDNGWSYSRAFSAKRHVLTNKATYKSMFRERRHIGMPILDFDEDDVSSCAGSSSILSTNYVGDQLHTSTNTPSTIFSGSSNMTLLDDRETENNRGGAGKKMNVHTFISRDCQGGSSARNGIRDEINFAGDSASSTSRTRDNHKAGVYARNGNDLADSRIEGFATWKTGMRSVAGETSEDASPRLRRVVVNVNHGFGFGDGSLLDAQGDKHQGRHHVDHHVKNSYMLRDDINSVVSGGFLMSHENEGSSGGGGGGAFNAARRFFSSEKSEKSGNRNFIREFWDRNLLRFNKHERKFLFWADYIERRNNLFEGKYAHISQILAILLFALMLLATFVPARLLILIFLVRRFRKGYKSGKYSRANRELVLSELKNEAQHWCVDRRQVRRIERWTRQTKMTEVFNLTTTLALRDWIHRRYFRNAYPLPVSHLQQFQTLDDLLKRVVSESLCFLRNRERPRSMWWRGGFFHSFLDHVPSNINEYDPDSILYYGHRYQDSDEI